MKNTYAVIMAGGVGSRFWPASKSKTPKQLLDLTKSGKTMLKATVERLAPEIPPDRVIIVTGKNIIDEVILAVPEVPKKNILAEPQGRNTAPCIGWAALHVKKLNPEGVMAVMPSDHLVAENGIFKEASQKAVNAADKGSIVTFGIVPSGPETGFGYIETGKEIADGIKTALGFVEKPDLETAEKYIAAGNFVWNSGMFFFRADKILNEIKSLMPELYKGLEKIEDSIGTALETSVLQEVFPALPSESIDYGIMEKAENILCVPVDFGWSDLGSWGAAYNLSEKDENRNVIDGESIIIESTDCLVRASDKKLIALAGVKDLIVVDTGDALLICNKDCDQDVKKVVNRLKELGKKELL
ncbi:MAG: mannose-1-phosphate guanylyltransferase [Deltaproteobacteria bacterium]|nr:mannose-1-phosphate guanylyltransferase [Deltaproteobacteria bacterium]